MDTQNVARWRVWLRYSYLAIITAAFCYALITQREELARGITTLGPWPIVHSVGLATLGVLASGLVWYTIIRGLGADLNLAMGARMFFITQLGKYVPGSIWPVMMQAEMAHSIGIPIRVAAMAQVLFMWVLVVTGSVLGTPMVLAEVVGKWVSNFNPWFMLSPLLLLGLLHPKLTIWVLNTILGWLKQAPLPQALGIWPTIQATCWALVMWACFGGHLFVIFKELKPNQVWLELVFIFLTLAFALAWVAGFLFLIAPAGLGVREAVFIAFSPGVDLGTIIVLLALSRVALTLADGICAGLAALGPKPETPIPQGEQPLNSQAPPVSPQPE